MLVLVQWLSLSSALAADCPWQPQPEVTARMTSVTVNGVRYQVRGKQARQDFERTLTVCNLPVAAGQFHAWRASDDW
ncbi:MAG: hypothetical protein H6735_22930 [Alphaproteobacteria bacterium]|nr:hypothetical protein [Alphaproteobacteria bacterium]